MTKMTTYRTQRKPWVVLHGLAATIAWGSRNAQLRYAVRCKTVQCLNEFTNDTQDVQTL